MTLLIGLFAFALMLFFIFCDFVLPFIRCKVNEWKFNKAFKAATNSTERIEAISDFLEISEESPSYPFVVHLASMVESPSEIDSFEKLSETIDKSESERNER